MSRNEQGLGCPPNGLCYGLQDVPVQDRRPEYTSVVFMEEKVEVSCRR